MASILETKLVTKKFGGFTAVDSVSLSVNRGEIVSILGPNGAGKSTLLRMMAGIYIKGFLRILIRNMKN